MYSQVAIASLFTLALAAPAPLSGAESGVKVPLDRDRLAVRDTAGAVSASWFFGQLKHTLEKYGNENVDFGFPAGDILKKRASVGVEALADDFTAGVDELYYGPVTVGATSPQTFGVDFDTGSADFFVPGPQCGKAQGCPGNIKYDQGGTDEGNTTTVTYGSGMIMGENYFDSVTVAGLTAKKTNVVSLTSATGFNNPNVPGLMGMGFSTIASSGQPTYFENLMSQGVVNVPEFSFFLGRGKSGTGSASELYLGGQDPSRYTGSITKVPVTTQGYWQVKLDTVIVNGQKPLLSGIGLDPTAGQAAIDTGTTIVLAPNLAALSIYSRVPGAFPVPVGGTTVIYAYPCNSPPDVEIVFAGKPFAINKADFSLGKLTSAFANFMGKSTLAKTLGAGNYCLGSIGGADINPTENLYVVGDTFLKNWYSIYNYKNYNGQPSVGFAKSTAP